MALKSSYPFVQVSVTLAEIVLQRNAVPFLLGPAQPD